MRNEPQGRGGFTLIEVVVAIVVLTIGILALAASAAATVRSMTESARTSGIARAADAERERAYASVCTAASGSDSVAGARVVWTAVPRGTQLTLHQLISLAPSSTRVTSITAVGACR